MATRLMDLATPVLLYLAACRRNIHRAVAVVPDGVRDELLTLFEEQDELAQQDSGFQAAWRPARAALIYLIDETFSRETEWKHAEWWRRHPLQPDLIGGADAPAGEQFFNELRVRKEAWDRPDHGGPFAAEVLAIYLTCLQLGFEGRYAGAPHELQRESQQILAKLPAGVRTQTRELFPDAYRHTVVLPPNYEPMMRMAVVAAVLIACVLVFVVVRGELRRRLEVQLDGFAERVKNDFAPSSGRTPASDDAPSTQPLTEGSGP